MAYQAILRKLPTATIEANLEDVFTATVFGAIAYGPPAMARSFLAEVAKIPVRGIDVSFEFWPQHRLNAVRTIEPDVFVRLGVPAKGALIIEAKQRADPHWGQLNAEADAARATVTGIGPLYLLTVSDTAVAPSAHTRAVAPKGPYRSARHVSWGDLCLFLEKWAKNPKLDVGNRRLIADTLAVMRKNKREPFRGISTMEVRRMETELPAVYALPGEIRKLHLRLERTLHGLATPLYLNDTERKVSIDNSGRSFDRPESWLPHCITLPYGADAAKRSSRYYFVRVLLERPSIWIGYSTPRDELKPLAADATKSARFVDALRAEGAMIAAVDDTSGRPFQVLREPIEPTLAMIRDLAASDVPSIVLVLKYPLTRLSEDHADELIEADLLRVIVACRAIDGLGAP